MSKQVFGAKFLSGNADSGRLILTRSDRSTAVCGVVIVRQAFLIDNSDSTFNLVFNGS